MREMWMVEYTDNGKGRFKFCETAEEALRVVAAYKVKGYPARHWQM